MTALSLPPTAFDEKQIDRFGFGRNWLDYQTSIDHARLTGARQDIEHWLGTSSLAGLRVLDIGSGSGVHSYCMHAMGASELVSFDYDADSVQATREFHSKAGTPDSWIVKQGSVLDADFMASLGTFDLVYSWGVLHHTGQMWRAIEHAAARVTDGGRFFISIYAKGPRFDADLELKQRYHRSGLSGKRRMEFDWIQEQYQHRARSGQNAEGWWTEGRERGMDPYYDLVDWLGGLPYEVATLGELTTNLRTKGIVTQRTRECMGDGGCHILVGQRTNDQASHVEALDAPATSTTRTRWPAGAPAVWIGAFDAAHAPDRVVPLARAVPHIAIVMIASGFSKLDADVRRQLSALAPNLSIVDAPAEASALAELLRHSGALLHTADAGPSSAWLSMAASVSLPVVSLFDDACDTIASAGLGIVGAGDPNSVACGVVALHTDSNRYASVSHAMRAWLADVDRAS